MQKRITLESILFKAINVLDSQKIEYWVTDGTLLGIVRENRILPWDSDVDIGVWKTKVSISKIIELFIENGFEYFEVLPDADSLHFRIDNVQLDINLYSEELGETSIKWTTNPTKSVDRFLVKIINAIFEYHKGTSVTRKKEFIGIGLMRVLLGLLGYLLTYKMLEKMYSFARRRYLYMGCTYPSELLKMKKIIFKDHELNVPFNCEEYLRLTYGEEWRKPNKEYVWEKDTFNLKNFKDNL